VERRAPRELPLRPTLEETVDIGEVERVQHDPAYRLVDVRAAERYRGETEPIDRIPGRIPGAVNLPYTQVMNADYTYRSAEALRELFAPVIGEAAAQNVVFYCGSGVTSVAGLLAFRLAGLGAPKLYPGSYSEWIADGTRPVDIGG
jgi:thiosulfate/3-mercaptopyruvate sulfurtransferase